MHALGSPKPRAVPAAGLMVLFPSTFWHHTIPFKSDDYRICIGFDAAAN
ncbi:MAG TPA: putative 2OG-Fe(II) oxygenase [Alphaproteobacteria bacterium]|nr:putative 2OG-Fe(II) oxygenase [Alphaproteobacteria bacterium]